MVKRKVSKSSAQLRAERDAKARETRRLLGLSPKTSGSDTVFVGGRGFSVAPKLQAKFIKAERKRQASAKIQKARKRKQTLALTKDISQLQSRKRSKAPPGFEPSFRSFKQPSGLKGIRSSFSSQVQTLTSKEARGKTLTPKDQASLLTFTLLRDLTDLGIHMPGLLKEIKRDPIGVAKSIPNSFIDRIRLVAKTAKRSPSSAVAMIGFDLILLKGTSQAIKLATKGGGVVASRLSGKFKGSLNKGMTIEVPGSKGKPSIKLKVVGKIPLEPIKKQVARAGKRVTAISSQADELLTLFNKKKIIRKPIPGEEELSLATRRALKRFDQRKLTKKQVIALDRAIRRQGKKGLLERVFFADPSGKIRPSRLGLTGAETEAGILDILSGDISFRSPKPQILLFEDIKVAKFPKKLASVKKKLASGKTLTPKEAEELLVFQLKKSGKFKPLGFASRESELTLAPGELIRKVKTVGVTTFKGKRIPIVKTEVFKPSGKLKTLLDRHKLNRGKPLTKAELKQLDRLLEKKTGFKSKLSSPKRLRGKRIAIKRFTSSALISKAKASKSLSRPKVSRGKVSKPVSRKPVSRGKLKRDSRGRILPGKRRPTGRRRPPVSPPKRPGKRLPKRLPGRPPKRPPGRPRVKPPIKIRFGSKTKRKKAKGLREGYVVQTKRRGKFNKVKSKPLSKTDAKDLLAHNLDNTLSRTGRIIPVGKTKLGSIPKKHKGSFAKNKKNLRQSVIRKGKKFKKINQWIEKKGGPVINTRGEKRQLKIARRSKPKKSIVKPKLRSKVIKRSRIIKRKPVKSKASPKQLANLKKGRLKLARMRKKNK